MKKLLTVTSAFALLMPSASVLNAKMMEETPSEPAMEVKSTEYVTPTAARNDAVTRAEFAAVLVDALIPGTANLGCFDRLDSNPVPPIDFIRIFSDVTTSDTHAMELCAGLRAGYLKGYADGSFLPEKTINTAEAAKMLTVAFALPAHLPTEKEVWYAPYTHALEVAGVKMDKNPAATFSMQEALDMIAKLQDLTGFAPLMQDDGVTEDSNVPEEEEIMMDEETSDTEETESDADLSNDMIEETSTGSGSVETPSLDVGTGSTAQ